MHQLQQNRKINLLQATAINMIDMVGIGPFVVMPLVIHLFGSGMFLWAWIFGAFIALVDGLIWSELGAAYPQAGGSYQFLRVAYGPRWGKMMSFLFVWQTCIQAPLVVASGAIGFAQYFNYLVPLNWWQAKLVSGTVVILIVFLLYRRIETIGKISVLLWAGVLITITWIIWGGMRHGTTGYNLFTITSTDNFFNIAFWMLVGQGSVQTIYSYLGYYNVCHLGGEIKNPAKNIPRSILISVIGIAVLYLWMNVSIVRVISWQKAQDSPSVVSLFMETLYGPVAANIATILILWIAFASLFAVVLGYSRVPYAAAADDSFFPIFKKLHPTKNFPYISLLFIGALGFLFSMLFKLVYVIKAILAMRILIQFIGQAVGAVLLRRRYGKEKLPFKMWLYPLPVILAILAWLFAFYSTGIFALVGLGIATLGLLVYFVTFGRK
jgi:fructoselysine transporter